jgi:hypothetical protein
MLFCQNAATCACMVEGKGCVSGARFAGAYLVKFLVFYLGYGGKRKVLQRSFRTTIAVVIHGDG